MTSAEECPYLFETPREHPEEVSLLGVRAGQGPGGQNIAETGRLRPVPIKGHADDRPITPGLRRQRPVEVYLIVDRRVRHDRLNGRTPNDARNAAATVDIRLLRKPADGGVRAGHRDWKTGGERIGVRDPLHHLALRLESVGQMNRQVDADGCQELADERNEIGVGRPRAETTDRKSTRLNSSHQIISYAVFCLKKKKYIC